MCPQSPKCYTDNASPNVLEDALQTIGGLWSPNAGAKQPTGATGPLDPLSPRKELQTYCLECAKSSTQSTCLFFPVSLGGRGLITVEQGCQTLGMSANGCPYFTAEYHGRKPSNQTNKSLKVGLQLGIFWWCFLFLLFSIPLRKKVTWAIIPTRCLWVARHFLNFVCTLKELSSVGPSFMQKSPVFLVT